MEAQEAPRRALNAKLDVNLDLVVDGQPVHIEAKVAGEGEAAQLAVEAISRAIAGVVSLSATTPLPASQTVAAPASVVAPAAPSRPATPPSPMLVWVQRNRARINIGFGAVLVALALLVPMIVPPAQRSDVLVLTILFTLAGALLLFTAFLPGKSRAVSPADAPPQPARTPVDPSLAPASASANAARRAQLLNPAPRHAVLKTSIGIGFSLVFIVAGLVAPFLLGATNADERFLIMLGFVPISVVGFFMLAIFGRQYFVKLLPTGGAATPAPAKAAGAPAPRRAPVNRVPQNVEYRAIVPIAIAGALVLMIVVVVVVIYATIASVAR